MGVSGLGVAEQGNPQKPKPAVKARGQPAKAKIRGSLNPRLRRGANPRKPKPVEI